MKKKIKPIILKSDISEPRGIDINPYFSMAGFISWAIAIGYIISCL